MNNPSMKERLRQGVANVTPLQLARAKRIGIWWQVAGMVCAMAFIAWQGPLYWLFFLAGVLFVLVLELVQVQQQVVNLERIAQIAKGGE
jgi:asparagine N-glycosylation enzyme membrane subunit Stt3